MAAGSNFGEEFEYFIHLKDEKDPLTLPTDSLLEEAYLKRLHYEKSAPITNGSFIEFLKDLTMFYLYLEGIFRKTLKIDKHARISMKKMTRLFFEKYKVDSELKLAISKWTVVINKYKHTAYTLMDTFEISFQEYDSLIEGLPEGHYFAQTNENLIAIMNVCLHVLTAVKKAFADHGFDT